MVPRSTRTKFILLLAFIIFAIVYRLIPIPGQLLIVPDHWQQINAWPQVRITAEDLRPGQEASLVIFDTIPWAHVKLIVEDGEGTLDGYELNSTTGVYQWNWSFTVPDTRDYSLKFYHNCDTGCRTWTTVATGEVTALDNVSTQPELIPTKLGVVFANPERDWHNRRGWVVELTYTQLAEAEYWGIDDLSRRVEAATNKGLLVLVRVDYDQGQSIPPPDDYLALDTYLNYIQRLARDDRLKNVYGYIIGSGFNTRGGNSQASENMVTPAWYARVFNGYNAPTDHTDNVVQTIRAENVTARILVGPVSPWRTDQDGALTYQIDVPWLNYFHTLVAAIDQATQEKASVGMAMVAPDGFAVQAPGRPDAPELTASERANEPNINLQRPDWDGAQAGFRVYQNWLDIINAHHHTKGLPVYISSTNTFQPDTAVEPAQNYPPGWLTTALDVVNQEPQIAALCWFLDEFPHDDQWVFFSLTEPRGLMVNAADEFDSLLQNTSR
jgi:hypothetical protein